MSVDGLPLFAWRPPVQLLAFPLARQVGRVRDVARKLSNKSTERHADQYTSQVTDALVVRLHRLNLPESAIDEEIGRFWTAVHQEVARLSYQSHGTGGSAA